MSFYYNTNNVLLVSDLDQAYKKILSWFIIMNGNMKEGCNKILRNQQMCGAKLFDLTWSQATSLPDYESLKVIQCNNSNGGGKKQDNKNDKETNGIVQYLMMGPNSDVEDLVHDNDKYSVPLDTEGNENPSLVSGGNFESEGPDNIALTLHHVGVICEYDDNDVYILTLIEVFDSIDQDHLFAHDDDDQLTVNEEIPAYLGMVLSIEDDSDNESKSKPDPRYNESKPKPSPFDVDDPENIFASTLFQATVSKTSSEVGAESWFEAVNIKFEICNLCNTTVYQEIFASSGA